MNTPLLAVTPARLYGFVAPVVAIPVSVAAQILPPPDALTVVALELIRSAAFLTDATVPVPGVDANHDHEEEVGLGWECHRV